MVLLFPFVLRGVFDVYVVLFEDMLANKLGWFCGCGVKNRLLVYCLGVVSIAKELGLLLWFVAKFDDKLRLLLIVLFWIPLKGLLKL